MLIQENFGDSAIWLFGVHIVNIVATDIHVRPLSSAHTTINPIQRLGS